MIAKRKFHDFLMDYKVHCIGRYRKNEKAFTLIELLIVVAIIGILAAIAVPNFLNAQTRAKLARCISDMKTALTSIEQLRLDTGYLPIDGWDDDTSEGRAILKDIFNGVGDFPEGQRKKHIISLF